MREQRVTISVVGSHDCDDHVRALAYQAGKLIAKTDCVLVCGGLGGVMEAACRGCREAGGMTIGLLPGKDKADANPYIDIALPTSIGFARNTIVACSADIVIALPGSYGTQSEICYALVYRRPVIDLGGWNIEGMIPVSGIEEAQQKIVELVAQLNA